jgi:hypothetical protein
MNCEQAVELLTGTVEPGNAADRRLATEHAADCADCRDAVVSVHALRVLSLMPTAKTPEGAFCRAMTRTTEPAGREHRTSGGFWIGLGAGAALAASVTLAILAVLSDAGRPGETLAPQFALALNESRDVSISLTTDEALIDAEIRVTLSGSIGLEGYTGQRELAWHADLDAGINQLTLPVIATGRDGGQLLVEVIHAGKRRSFLVDVQARA